MNSSFRASIPLMTFLRLLKMLATSALRSINAETHNPKTNTTTIEPRTTAILAMILISFPLYIGFIILLRISFPIYLSDSPSSGAIRERAIPEEEQ